MSPSKLVIAAALALGGCGGGVDSDAPPSDALGCDPSATATRTISCTQAFTPGDGAGFGAEAFPAVIYGDPKGGGSHSGSTDVLSLGKGGVIVVGFGGNEIVDADGPDFVVFENPFDVGGDPTNPFKELGEISVSEDGVTWKTFPCHAEAYPYDGCAGWNPVFANDAAGISPFDADAGGDRFDLADVAMKSARLVRIRDISNYGAAPDAGFDLDAAAILHARAP